MPALHGLYRAISSTLYCWALPQWEALTTHLKVLCSPGIIDRLNRLLLDIIQLENADADTLSYVQTLVARYVAQGRPLSGYFMVCCVLETEWTILAQALAPPLAIRSPVIEAAAANKAWLSLTRNAAVELNIEGDRTKFLLRDTIRDTMKCFSDLLVQIEQMDSEPSLDTYAWETMSESLVRSHLAVNHSYSQSFNQKLASICCLALREIDDRLYSQIMLLLSTDSRFSGNLVQEAALKATTVLVRTYVYICSHYTALTDFFSSFPVIATDMVVHLRRFVTSPLPLFEFGFSSEARTFPPISAAAKCLAICIKVLVFYPSLHHL